MVTPLHERSQALRLYLKTPGFRRLLRYSSVSAISTATSLTLLYIFFRVLKVGSAAESNVIATAITTIPAYYLNRTWAWGRSGRSHLMREVVPFWVIAFGSLVLSTAVVALAAHEAHHITHSHTGVTILVELANFCTYGTLWIGKYLLFNKFLFARSPGPETLGDRDVDEEPLAPPSLAPLSTLVEDKALHR